MSRPYRFDTHAWPFSPGTYSLFSGFIGPYCYGWRWFYTIYFCYNVWLQAHSYFQFNVSGKNCLISLVKWSIYRIDQMLTCGPCNGFLHTWWNQSFFRCHATYQYNHDQMLFPHISAYTIYITTVCTGLYSSFMTPCKFKTVKRLIGMLKLTIFLGISMLV